MVSTNFLEYFTLLDVLPAFDLDLAGLEANYFREQRNNHPDRFVGKPDAVRVAAAQRSADINLAYDNLKDPLKRARYLLLLQGIFIGTDKDNVKPSSDLLTEVMELQEELAGLDNMNDLYEFLDELEKMREKLLNFIGAAYTKGQWDRMSQLVLKLGYVQKTIEDVKKKKSRIKKI